MEWFFRSKSVVYLGGKLKEFYPKYYLYLYKIALTLESTFFQSDVPINYHYLIFIQFNI